MNRKIFLIIVQVLCVYSLYAQENAIFIADKNDAVKATFEPLGLKEQSDWKTPASNVTEVLDDRFSTISAASALVLIDGIEGDINSLDPANVKNFSVLKGASATAVYGKRGENGVVLITTKSGSKDLIEEPEPIKNKNVVSSGDSVKMTNLKTPASKISEVLG